MKTGEWTPLAITLTCPYCGSEQYHPATGTLMFDAEAFFGHSAGEKWECETCALVFKLPTIVDKF